MNPIRSPPYETPELVLAKRGACLIWEVHAKRVRLRVLLGQRWMGQGLSLSARREITKQSAAVYARAAKNDKGWIRMIWSLSRSGRGPTPAVRCLALKRKTPVRKAKRKPRPRTLVTTR